MKLHGIAQAINLLLTEGENTQGKAICYEDYIVIGSQRLYFQDEWVIEEAHEEGTFTDRYERLEDAVDKFICFSGE